MKKKLFFYSVIATTVITIFNLNYKNPEEKLKEKHAYFLENSPFKETQFLSKSERKNRKLPPNPYNEMMWDLTLDPNTGRPMPERVLKLQQQLKQSRILRKGGADDTNPWIDRGPNNIGGRTRSIMFDPNDSDNKRVFSGGVSGGLWVNEDITDPNSSWNLVEGIGANIAVTKIIYDPNNTSTFYIGSGESYTTGDAVGRGIWKSTDAGATWSIVFGGGADGTSSNGGQVRNGIFYVNDIVARNIGDGSTELYATIAGASFNGSTGPAGQFTGLNEQGLYKSLDGENWSKIIINESDNSPSNPNDIELDLDNNIWLTTTRSSFGSRGGKIFKSNDGNTFTLMHTIPSADRTELVPSKNDVNKFWIAVDRNTADLFYTDDAFENVVQLPEPNDVDNGIGSTDYTRGQAFYDLPIEVDNNDVLYIGGIDLFRSFDEGETWEQISKWSNNNNLSQLNVPLVHADQHAIVFMPGEGNENKVVFGNDGGIYYCDDISLDATSIEISSRIKDYNVTQFYYGAIGPEDTNIIAGGTQDNGTPIVIGAEIGANNFSEPFGGDGAFTDIDNEGEYMIQTYTNNSHTYFGLPNLSPQIDLTNKGGGIFINVAALDKNLDVFYAISTNGIERVTGFTPGGRPKLNFELTNNLLNSTISAMKVSPYTTDASNLFVGLRNGRLLKITAAEASTTPTWTRIDANNFVGSISDIEFGESESEIFVTIHNYGVNSIWYTNDSGDNWKSIEGNLPDLPVKCIVQNPLRPSELFIGTGLGVWRTDNFNAGSPSWSQAYNGMSDVPVVDLDVRNSDYTILATTHGRGFFTSTLTADAASTDNFTAEKLFTVYPTKNNGSFTINTNNNLGNSKVEIIDITGKKVYVDTRDFDKNKNQKFNINISSGLYILNIISNNNQRSSSKIIIE